MIERIKEYLRLQECSDDEVLHAVMGLSEQEITILEYWFVHNQPIELIGQFLNIKCEEVDRLLVGAITKIRRSLV